MDGGVFWTWAEETDRELIRLLGKAWGARSCRVSGYVPFEYLNLLLDRPV